MFGIENFTVFVSAGILLNLYPGPDTIYIIGRSVSQGRAAGVCAALGIGSGGIVHTMLGAFGLSAILATSAHAFMILKIAGCLYLFYQGVRMILDSSTEMSAVGHMERTGLWRIFRQGALTNVLNPKVAVFFLAFLPQFIDAASSSKALAFIILGLTFMTTGTLWCLVVAVLSSSFGCRIRQSAKTSGYRARAGYKNLYKQRNCFTKS